MGHILSIYLSIYTQIKHIHLLQHAYCAPEYLITKYEHPLFDEEQQKKQKSK